MKIHTLPPGYYIGRLRDGAYFSFPGFSDAEWIAILKRRIGEATALGQVWTDDIGNKLVEAFRSHPNDQTYMRAVPMAIHQVGPIVEDVQAFIDANMASVPLYERDTFTDDLAAVPGGLFHLIQQLRKMNVVIVSHAAIRGIKTFLLYDKFVEVSTPNFHMEDGGIERVVDECLEYGKPGVYLFSAGMSAAVMISKLHGKIKNSFFLDVGSIWDAFAGVGGQREWRAKLYADPIRYEQWVRKNLYGLFA